MRVNVGRDDSVIIILVNDIEDACHYENLPQRKYSISVLRQQLISNVKHLNELSYLISSGESLTESIKGVKEIIEKIANRIEMTGGFIEKPKISCQKRKHPFSTSSTYRKKFKNLPANKIKKHTFAG